MAVSNALDILLDSSGNIITDSVGNPIYARRNGGAMPYSDRMEAYLGYTKIHEDTAVRNIYIFDRFFEFYSLLPVHFFPIAHNNLNAALYDYITGSQMTVSGDINYNWDGFYSDGSASYLNTGVNPSTRITDINNFAMGIFSNTDNDSGIEVGATDGTNELSIACRSSSNMEVKIGTLTLNKANDNGKGHYSIHVNAGTATGYKRGTDYYLETINSGSVTGALPNYNLFLNARSDSGSADNYSQKKIGFLWLYNGQLSSEEFLGFEIMMFNYAKAKGLMENES